MDLAGALAYLAEHINLESDVSTRAAARRLDRTERLLQFMGDPHRAYPVLHLTGTNGKGSTSRMLSALLTARGLSVGTYTSPHLERVNERLSWGGEPIPDAAFAEVISAVAGLEPLLADRLTHFEILTTAAFRWFADVAVDAAVVEVGLGGRWDATNVVDGAVAVVTNVALDHAETIGPALTDIAREKAGIVKPGSVLVQGETEPELAKIFRQAPASEVWERDSDFGCDANRLAHDGRVVDLFTPGARYREVFVSAHGAFQGDNAAAALAAAEAFFGAPLEPDVVSEAFAHVELPGRLEVIARDPLCVLDGAHNPAGARASSAAVQEAFGAVAGRVLVVGMLRGRDPHEMLRALDADRARLVVACAPPSPRAMPAEELAAAARDLGLAAEATGSVPQAVVTALALAAPGDLVLITGSLYVVGAARATLRTDPPTTG